MDPWCTSNDVKTRLAGNPAYVPALFDASIAAIIDAVSVRLNREIRKARGIHGTYTAVADSTASAHTFTGRAGAIRLLPIDDCIAVSAVTSNGQALVSGTDYALYPLNAETITGIMRLNGSWSQVYGGISVTAKWGTWVDLPSDLWDDAVSESVSVYLSARAGHDDTIGMDAFGKIVTAKALLSKTLRDIHQYGHGAGALR